MTAWMRSNAPADYPHLSDMSARNVCALAKAGDELARRAVEREARYLGVGIANLVTIFVPDAIALSGSLMKSADLFLPTIRKTIARSCRFVPADKTELALASLGDDANLIGAGRVWFYRFDSSQGRI